MTTVSRAVPGSLKAKNREKARERIYLPVCLHLTQKVGTGPKGLMVMSRENRSAKTLTFTPQPLFGGVFLCLSIENVYTFLL